MKPLLILTILTASLAPLAAQAQDLWIDGYTRSNGTYVQGYYQTQPDGNVWNNYSTKGNVNPYTGEKGTVDPYSTSYGDTYGSSYSQSAHSSHHRGY